MSSTPAMIAAIVADLQADSDLSDVRKVLYHGGEWTEKELTRYSANAPALILTWLGYEGTGYPTEPYATAAFALFVVTRKVSGHADRHLLAQSVSDTILRKLIQGAGWSVASAGKPQDPRAENLYSAGFDSKGVAVHVIRWTQQYALDNPADTGLDDFTDLYADWEKVRETDDEQPLAVDTHDATDHVELDPPS